MNKVIIHLKKPYKNTEVVFDTELLNATETYRYVKAIWGRPRLDLGYIVFETDDRFFEYYYTDRWYSIFEIRTVTGMLKGWYGNISRPAHFTSDSIISEDLDLDLFVSADRDRIMRLDIDEFEQRGLATADPDAYAAAYAALDELEAMARAGLYPFDQGSGIWDRIAGM